MDTNHADVFVGKRKKAIQWRSNFFGKQELITFLMENNIVIDFAQTQYNAIVEGNIIKVHGDPTINHHDWVVVGHAGKKFVCHILCFVWVTDVTQAVEFAVGKIEQSGQYAICHFVDQDVFCENKPDDFMYGNGNYTSYRTDENCSLVRGWAKYTSAITQQTMPRRKPIPTMALFDVKNIISTCIGIEDNMNPIPHSYIFLPPRCQWPSLFKQRMKDLMEKEGDYVASESENEDDSEENESENEDDSEDSEENEEDDDIDSDNDDNDEY